jgi:hypothetical protein
MEPTSKHGQNNDDDVYLIDDDDVYLVKYGCWPRIKQSQSR